MLSCPLEPQRCSCSERETNLEDFAAFQPSGEESDTYTIGGSKLRELQARTITSKDLEKKLGSEIYCSACSTVSSKTDWP